MAQENTCQSQYVDVNGSRIHYLESGAGNPILFLHGVPTSSYLWRNIIPYLSPLARCIAPDLIGFGKSDKPDIHYSIQDHIEYINAFIETLNLRNITFVLQEWGSIIGFDIAMRNEKNANGLVFYEAFLRPIQREAITLPFQEQLMSFHTEDEYDALSDGISFVDKVIPQQIMRQLTNEEMNSYREPFIPNGSGKPIQQYLKELLKPEENSKVNQVIQHYAKKLAKSSIPKLMLYSVPGFITPISTVMWAKKNLANLEVVDIGEELHLAQETYPEIIGKAISVWLQGVEQHH